MRVFSGRCTRFHDPCMIFASVFSHSPSSSSLDTLFGAGACSWTPAPIKFAHHVLLGVGGVGAGGSKSFMIEVSISRADEEMMNGVVLCVSHVESLKQRGDAEKRRTVSEPARAHM